MEFAAHGRPYEIVFIVFPTLEQAVALLSPSSRDLHASVSVRSNHPPWFPAYVAVENVQSLQKTLLMSTQVFGSSSFEFCQRPLDGGAEFILNGVQQEGLVLAVHISFPASR